MKKLWIVLMALMSVGMAHAEKETVVLTTSGDMEGENTCVLVKPTFESIPVYATPEQGKGKDGSKGVYLEAPAEAENAYGVAMYIEFDKPLYEGDVFTVEFDYMASNDVTIRTQAHGEPTYYHHWDAIGVVSFTKEWQHYSKTVTVTAEMMGENKEGMKSICFTLGQDNTGKPHVEPITFFLDNVFVTAQVETAKDEYVMYIPPLTITPGEVVEMPIMLKNTGDVKHFFATISLPEGFTLELDAFGYPAYALNQNRWEEGFTTIPCWVFIGDGPAMISYDSEYPYQLKKEDGIVATLRVKADPSVKSGTYEAQLQNINFNRDSIIQPDYKTTFTVPWKCSHIQGDVDGDGKVTVADISKLIEILLNQK